MRGKPRPTAPRRYSLKGSGAAALKSNTVLARIITVIRPGTPRRYSLKAASSAIARSAGTLKYVIRPTPGGGLTVNAKTQYGATGNGTTDDTVAINNAIAYVAAQGGGTVYLPTGTYQCTANWHNPNIDMSCFIELLSNVTLTGDGQGLTVVRGAHDLVSTIGASQRTHVTVSNLTALSLYAGSCDGVKMYACDDVLIDHVTGGGLSGQPTPLNGIAIYGGRNNIVRDCIGQYTSNAGFHLSGNALDLAAPSGYGGNNITGLRLEAISCNKGFRSTTYTAGRSSHIVTGITWDNCYAHQSAICGYYIDYINDVTVTDCRSVDNAGGSSHAHLEMYTCDTVTIHNFQTSGTGEYAKVVSGCTNVLENS
jgi:polygalacturonase